MAHSHHHHHHHHEHSHQHSSNPLAKLAMALHLPGFTHDHSHHDLAADRAFLDNRLAVRTVWIALIALGLTTALQIVIYLASNSVALLADTVHNLGDALNSIPLLFAFYIARRAANKRYTYGYGRLEDIAGVFIVISIGFSAAFILIESVERLFNPLPLENLEWIALASLVGFLGNELVAVMQIRVGRRIGSDAMIADGQHALIDGLTLARCHDCRAWHLDWSAHSRSHRRHGHRRCHCRHHLERDQGDMVSCDGRGRSPAG